MHTPKHSSAVIFSCSHISKKFGQIEVLKDVSFTIGKGERAGLVGPNGSGKSTLLKMIAGVLETDGGAIEHAKKLKIEYLPQIHLDQDALSGGEMAKKILQPLMASHADLFVLDEPTNNLDEDGLMMVENFITKSNKAFLIVSHDRAFLDAVANKIIELDPKTKSSSIYEGGYSDYLDEKEAKIARQWKEYSEKVEKTGRLVSSLNEKISYVRKIETKRLNNRNLPMHEKEKPTAAVLRDKEGRAGRRAKVMKNRLERFQEKTGDLKKPHQGLPLDISFDHERGGVKVFELKKVEKRMGKRIIGPIDVRISYGDRLHIRGKNGTGKTTLLKMFTGEIVADSGVLERGENVKIGYISQERWLNRPNKKVIEEFLESTQMEETIARELLNRFRITTEDVKKHISELSPGEYSRLLIAELAALRPNCIILDEPSNHLDLEALNEFERGLKGYEGTLIVVSHDRYFVKKLGFTSEFMLDEHSQKSLDTIQQTIAN